MSEEHLLTAGDLQMAFKRLAELLDQRHLTADVFVFGGAAMVLGYDARPATRDVDAIWRPHGAVLEAAWEVAAEQGLPKWWLNEQAIFYLPAGTGFEGASLFEAPGLRVIQASSELLLALKVAAARTQDLEDIRLLVEVLGLTTSEEVLGLASRVLGEPIASRSRMIIEDLFE